MNEATLSKLLGSAIESARKAEADVNDSAEEARAIDALRVLAQQQVSMELLGKTAAGKRVKKLEKHPCAGIAAAAAKAVEAWKECVRKEKSVPAPPSPLQQQPAAAAAATASAPTLARPTPPPSTSQSGPSIQQQGSMDPSKTQRLTLEPAKTGDETRDKIRKLLAEALALAVSENACGDPCTAAVSVEKAMFAQSRGVNQQYKAKFRSLSFNLKDPKNPDLRARVLEGDIEAQELVEMSAEQLASSEKKAEYSQRCELQGVVTLLVPTTVMEQIREHIMAESVRGNTQVASTDQFQCGRCKQRKCTYYQMQTRSADEAVGGNLHENSHNGQVHEPHWECSPTARPTARPRPSMRATSGLALGQRPRIAVPKSCNVPMVTVRRLTAARCRFVTRVAAIEEQTNAPEPSIPGSEDVLDSPEQPVAEGLPDLELAELDAAQEQLLSWMMFTEEAQQEEELDEMVDYDEFVDDEYAELFEEVEQMVDGEQLELKVGDKVKGVVYAVDGDGAYVEIGDKASGFVPLEECSFAKLKTVGRPRPDVDMARPHLHNRVLCLPMQPLEVVRVGMEREFVVIEREDKFGQTVLSLATEEVTMFWHRMRQLSEEDVTVYVKVESANKGGLLVKYGPYDGFIPVSQFGSQVTPESMESLVGYDLPVKFLEINEDTDRLVFSNKRASSMSAAGMQGYKIGDVVEGVVQSIKPYGAFVDLGGITGLLHLTQISHQRIMSVDKILKEGDKLKVMILSHDRDRGRVTLSTKKLEPNPGDMLTNPQLVYEKAEEMAELFKARVSAAETQSRTDDSTGDQMAAETYVY
ncbi:hypothetical protein QJQ45_027756 [Haematococcus lacustris]|nr:hypothetical protein QJQ45_027756 [Haematococcus lacustris]